MIVSIALVAAYWSALATWYVIGVVIELASLGDLARWAAIAAVVETVLFWALLRGSGERLAGLGLSFAALREALRTRQVYSSAMILLCVQPIVAALYSIARGTNPGPNPLASTMTAESLPLWMGLSLLAGFREELERAFCITRFERGFGTPGLVTAILVDAVLFGRGHWNQGTLGMITNGVMGVGFSLVFLRRRRVADAMVAHAFMDLLAVVALSARR